MIVNHMVQLVKQLSGKISPNVYTSVQGQTGAAQVAFLRQLQRESKRENVLETPLCDLKVVVFDLETTGFNPHNGDQILSIGAVKIQGEEVSESETFYSLVHCEQELSEELIMLTGITRSEISIAPKLQDVIEKFYYFIKSDTLVAHHANHEKQFMQHATWNLLRTHFQHRILDTSFLLKVIEPNQKMVSLDDCLEYFNIDIVGRHHALQDSLMTAKLWSESLKRAQKMGFTCLHDIYTQLAKLR